MELRDAFNKHCVNRQPGTVKNLMDQFLRESVQYGSLSIQPNNQGGGPTVVIPQPKGHRERAVEYFTRA